MFFKKNIKEKGSAMVEIIVGASIMLVGILAINASFSTYIEYAFANQKNIEANYLLSEGLDVFSFFRDTNWLNISGLSTTTTYYLSFGGTNWATTTSPQYVDGLFLRSLSITDVNRDSNDDITNSSGTYDPNTKLVTVTVSYFQGKATTTKTLSKYIANIR